MLVTLEIVRLLLHSLGVVNFSGLSFVDFEDSHCFIVGTGGKFLTSGGIVDVHAEIFKGKIITYTGPT